jgi:PBP1b-binding outer membrane lipoprotein LpoB
MKKIILATVSSLALLGLAACSDTDTTTTQSIDPAAEDTATPAPNTNVTVVPEADENAPADPTTTQSIEPDTDTTNPTSAAPEGTADEIDPADDVPTVQ